MKNRGYIKLSLFVLLLLLTGCGRNTEQTIPGVFEAEPAAGGREETIPGASGTEPTAGGGETIPGASGAEPAAGGGEETIPKESGTKPTAVTGSEELLDAFLANEIPAIYNNYNDEEEFIMFDSFPFDEEDWFSYSVGERIDLDNDGENEQIVDGPYGGIYFDARDGKVYVLARGEGTAGVLSYTNYDNAVWIVHGDTTHGGRQMYWLAKYDGEGNIADEFQLSAEYWDSPDDKYDENSDFTYRDEKVSMKEYEALSKEIFGW